MNIIVDLVIINISALFAFLLRLIFGDFVVKQSPILFWPKYLAVLLFLNMIYPIIFWLLGLYDKRQKRALLEEFILIFGVFSTSVAILIIFLFLGRLWWMSRIVLFAFWGSAILLLCISRLIIRTNMPKSRVMKSDLSVSFERLAGKKAELQSKISDKLSIIIVTFNSMGKVENCLGSIRKAGLRSPFEVIVVDNNSQDGTADFLSQQKEIRVINNQVNVGYSKAVNIGIKAAASDMLLILNPDIAVIPGSIEVMLNYLVSHPQVGLAGCKLLNEDGTLQYSVRRFLDLRTYLYRFTPLRGLMAGSAIERYYLMQEWDHNDDRLVDWVLGGCMLARKKALTDVGLMTDSYFIYFEDVDLCFKLWEKGWQVAYVAEAVMFHKHVRASANKLFKRATYEHFKSLFLFLRKHGFRLPKSAPSNQE